MKKRKPGRPPAEDPKLNLPSVRIKRSTLSRIEERAIQTGQKRSWIVQSALDLYFNLLDHGIEIKGNDDANMRHKF